MAVSATITTAPTISGGTATVYPQSNWPYGTDISGAPVGSSVTTGAVGTNGSVTFTGLNPSTLYVAYQASPDRYVRFRTAAAAATPAGGGSLTPTTVKTGSYTAASGDLVLVDTTSGAVTVTLPAAAAGSTVGVKMVTQGGANAVTIAAAGPDVFNKAGGPATAPLTLLNQGVVLAGSSGVWVVQADDLALSQLDLRYGSDVWRPTSQGFLAQSCDPAITTFSGLTVGAGVMRTARIPIQTAKTITNLVTVLSSGGSTLTGAIGLLYKLDGTLIARTASQNTPWSTSGVKTMALTPEAGQSLALPAADVIGALLVVTAGSAPGVSATSQVNDVNLLNAGFSSPGFRGGFLTGQASVPTTLSGVSSDTKFVWLGLS